MSRARARKVRSAGRPAGSFPDDRKLVAQAIELLRRRYVAGRHTVAAAVRARSGAVYLGVNLDGIHTPCAEPIAVGAAVIAGDGAIEAMVAVCRRGRAYEILSPCGTCRQLLFDYAPRAYALVPAGRGRARRLRADALLPSAFSTFGS
jgi:cytidine deaminase